jgi:hypothetical protein
MRAERKRQQKFQNKQNRLVLKSQRQAANQHDETLANNQAQFNQTRQDSMDQFNATMAWQAAQAESQMSSQQAQFAAAQAAQEMALQQQLVQNEEMARRSEEAANRAMGMKLIGQNPDSVKVKSAARKKARKKATSGTSQLYNSLTISMGGG